MCITRLQQLSQFWYDEKTCDHIVECAHKLVGSKGTVALLSCPTLYKTFKKKSPTIASKFCFLKLYLLPNYYKSPICFNL